MSVPKLSLVCLCLALSTASELHSAPASDLADLAGRIDYGFYTGDRAVLAAAREELMGLEESRPLVLYYRAFAAMRSAQLDLRRGRTARKSLEHCLDSAEAATEAEPMSAEPWILIGACSALAADERRLRHALVQARALDADNPRIGLVEAWGMGYEPDALDVAQTARLTETLGATVAAFAASLSRSLPDWGEAEAAAALGGLLMQQGEVRAARDLIEQALLVAPGFEPALDLRRKLVGQR